METANHRLDLRYFCEAGDPGVCKAGKENRTGKQD